MEVGKVKRAVLLSIIAISSISTVPIMAKSYEIIDLGTLGGDVSYASSINNSGQIVGDVSNGAGNIRAILFDSTGAGNNIDLGTLGGSYGSAYSINDNNQILGISESVDGKLRTTLFDSTGAGNNIDLHALFGVSCSVKSINNKGQGVGEVFNNGFRAALFDLTGAGNYIDLGTLGGNESVANSINDNGQIVGRAYNAEYNERATLFDSSGNGNNLDLGTLGGQYSRAKSINNQGQIVGDACDSVGFYRATLFNSSGNGNNLDLGTIGGKYSSAWSINNNGQIIGWSGNTDFEERPTLFDETGNGNNIDLNTVIDSELGWTLIRVGNINDNGWIVGYGTNPNGYTHAFLLIPIEVSLSIDIKPRDCSNLLNVKSKGMLPVAILGSESYDINEIDITTLEILGVRAIRSSYKDVATPLVEEILPEDCLCTTDGPDGYMDLTLKFNTQEIVEAIGEVEDSDYIILTLTGSLVDGTAIEGTDCVIIKK